MHAGAIDNSFLMIHALRVVKSVMNTYIYIAISLSLSLRVENLRRSMNHQIRVYILELEIMHI